MVCHRTSPRYGSALTACARSNMREVYMLLHEMESRGLPLQESVLISVIMYAVSLRLSSLRERSNRRCSQPSTSLKERHQHQQQYHHQQHQR